MTEEKKKKKEVYSLPCSELPVCFKWFLDIELAVIFGQWFLDIAVAGPVNKTATIGSDNSQTRHTHTHTQTVIPCILYFLISMIVYHCEHCQSESIALFSHPSLHSVSFHLSEGASMEDRKSFIGGKGTKHSYEIFYMVLQS